MKTIKLPFYTAKLDTETIVNLQKQFSNTTRYSYNRILENIPLSKIEKDIKILNNIDLMDSWFIRCSTLKAKSILKSIEELNKITEKQNKINEEKNEILLKSSNTEQYKTKYLKEIKELIVPQKVIFGTKYNFYQRLTGKIDNKEYKENRLMLINIQGEENQNGNRKFEFDLDNNQIKFKINKSKHITINLPKLRRNIFKQLRFIQEHKLLYSIELGIKNNKCFIHISFDEVKINTRDCKKIENRVLGIDLNPNFIGYSIQDISKNNEKQEILLKNCYDLSELNEKLNVKSSDKKQQYQNNKRDYEILQIAKDIVTQAIHFKVEKIVIEELNLQTQDNKKANNSIV